MAAGLLLPEEVGPADAARVLGFLNAAGDAATLSDAIGLSEGPSVMAFVANAILERRAAGPFTTLQEVLSVTGVTAARFTEIVMALSGARPSAGSAGRVIQIRPAAPQPLLGQGIGVLVQLLDAVGRGVPGAEVTCVTTWGSLTARSGTSIQRGASAKLVTEPGGLIRLRLEPPIAPPLSDDARAVLDVELARLAAAGDNAGPVAAGDNTNKVAAALAAFADHYRAEAADPLREAVDRLFTTFPTEALTPDARWTVIPVTLIAFAGGEGADVVGLATLPVRSWLAPFLAALRAQVTGDRRIDDALANLPLEQTAGSALARGIFSAQEALLGLERGVLGQKFGDEIASDGVGRFLELGAARIEAAALVDATRAVGASTAAIRGGGFAVFDAIGAVREVEDTIGDRLGLLTATDGRLSILEAAVADVRATMVDVAVVNGLAADLTRETSRLDGLLTEIQTSQVTQTDLAALDTRIGRVEQTAVTRTDLAALNTRIGQIEANQVTQADLTALDTRIGRVEETAVTRTELTTLNTRLSRIEASQVTRTDLAALDARIGQVETGQVTATDLAALETRLDQRIATDVAATRTELGARIDSKADVAALSGVQQSVSGLQTETTRLSAKVDTVDARVTTISPTRTIRPGP